MDFCLGDGGGLLRSRLASLRLGLFLGRMPNPPGYEGALWPLALDATSIASFLMTRDFTAARPYLALGPYFALALLFSAIMLLLARSFLSCFNFRFRIASTPTRPL